MLFNIFAETSPRSNSKSESQSDRHKKFSPEQNQSKFPNAARKKEYSRRRSNSPISKSRERRTTPLFSRSRSRSPLDRKNYTKLVSASARSTPFYNVRNENSEGNGRKHYSSKSRSPSPQLSRQYRETCSRSSGRYYPKRSDAHSNNYSNHCISPNKQYKKYNVSDQDVEKFFEDEKLLMEKMNNDKKRFLISPEQHPDYEQEWEKFYTSKCFQFGPMHPSYLQEDWASAWKHYFFKKHETLVRQERNILLNKHRLYYSDLEKYEERKLQLSKQEPSKSMESTDGNPKGKSELERSVRTTKSIGKQNIEICSNKSTLNIDSHMNSPNPAPVLSKFSNMSSMGKSFPILQTLRLLSAIEDDIGSVGPLINIFLMRINTMESETNDKSNRDFISILKDGKFIDCIKSAKAILEEKLSNTAVKLSENKTKAYLTVIEHVNQLLETKSFTENTSIHEKSSSTTCEEMIKSKIEKKVVEEFKKAGRILLQDEKEQLVTAEFKRILPQLRQEIAMPELGTKNGFNNFKKSSQRLGLPKNSLESPCLHSYNSHPYQKSDSSKTSDSLVNSINWEELRKVVSNISQFSSNSRLAHKTTPETNGQSCDKVSRKDEDFVEIIDDDVVLLEEIEQKNDIVCLDDLSFDDLSSLCTNIKKLDQKTQNDLIQYMKNLEKTNPNKVEELKKFLKIW